jgi:hypothetical protein
MPGHYRLPTFAKWPPKYELRTQDRPRKVIYTYLGDGKGAKGIPREPSASLAVLAGHP